MTYELNKGILFWKSDIKNGSSLKIPKLRREYSQRNTEAIHQLAIACAVMFSWLLIWALVLKLGNEDILRNLYINLKDMTLKDRILWDIIPFNYRGEGDYKRQIIIDSLLNCLAFAPFSVLLCYVFEKPNIFRDILICLGFSVGIELLQLVTMLGNPATEDLITNLAGCIIGYVFYFLLFRRLSLSQTVKTAAVLSVILAMGVIYSIVTTVGAADLIFKIVTRTL